MFRDLPEVMRASSPNDGMSGLKYCAVCCRPSAYTGWFYLPALPVVVEKYMIARVLISLFCRPMTFNNNSSLICSIILSNPSVTCSPLCFQIPSFTGINLPSVIARISQPSSSLSTNLGQPRASSQELAEIPRGQIT